jgi:hypothetical protein
VDIGNSLNSGGCRRVYGWHRIVVVGGSLGRSGRRIVSDVGGSHGRLRSGRRIVLDVGGSHGRLRSGRRIVLKEEENYVPV